MGSKFWKDKKVLITGFEGFLGSNLSRTLISLGARMFGLDIRVRRKETILTGHDYKKISQQIGEIRAMSLANEKEISRSTIEAGKVVDIVKFLKQRVKPNKEQRLAVRTPDRKLHGGLAAPERSQLVLEL